MRLKRNLGFNFYLNLGISSRNGGISVPWGKDLTFGRGARLCS